LHLLGPEAVIRDLQQGAPLAGCPLHDPDAPEGIHRRPVPPVPRASWSDRHRDAAPHAPVGRRMHVFPNGRLHGPSPRLPRPHSTSPSSPNPGGRNALWRDQQPVGHPLARPCIHFRTESCRTVSRGTRSGTHAPAMTTGNHPPGMEPSPVVVKSGHIDHAGKWRWDDRPFGLRQFPYTHIDGTETVPGSADSWSC